MATVSELRTGRKLLCWVNKTLATDLQHIEELATGAVFCQLLDSLFENTVPLANVHYTTDKISHFKLNFALLASGFQKLCIAISMPVEQLVRGDFAANLSFAKRFYKFYRSVELRRHHLKGKYNAPLARNFARFAIAPPTIQVANRSTQTTHNKHRRSLPRATRIMGRPSSPTWVTLQVERNYYLVKLGELQDLLRKHRREQRGPTIDSAAVQKVLYKTETGFVTPKLE